MKAVFNACVRSATALTVGVPASATTSHHSAQTLMDVYMPIAALPNLNLRGGVPGAQLQYAVWSTMQFQQCM
jgi:hypothetical protein